MIDNEQFDSTISRSHIGSDGKTCLSDFEEAKSIAKDIYKHANQDDQYAHAVAHMLTHHHDFIWVGDEKGYFARKEGYIYKSEVELDLEQVVRKYYGEDGKCPGEYIGTIKSIVKADKHFNLKEFDKDRDLIFFKNGIFNIRTWDWNNDTDEKAFIEIPWEYDENASLPMKFLDYLDLLWGDDCQTKNTICEWIGYCLTKRIDMQKAMMFTSKEGATFKSSMTNIIDACVGHENTAKTPLAKWSEEKHGKSNFGGKLLNYFSDLPKRFPLKNVGVIKDGITDDEMDIEIKFQTPTKIKNILKQLYSCNGLPLLSLDDLDMAFCRRWIIIYFFPRILGINVVKDWEFINIINDEEEMRKIICYCMMSLRELYKRGYFLGQSWEDIQSVWRNETSIIYRFVEKQCYRGKCNADVECFQVQPALYNEFVEFQQDEANMEKITQQKFTAELKMMGITVMQKKIGGTHVRVYTKIHSKCANMDHCDKCPCFTAKDTNQTTL